MANIIINISDDNLILSGDIEAIQDNRRAKSNFEAIGASFEHSEKIILSLDEKNKDQQYQIVEELLSKFKIISQQTPDAQIFLKDINQRKEDFANFSEKAKNIRNKHYEVDDFKNFTDVVKRYLKRKLYFLQLLSAYHMAFAQNACNFSVPGAGKTSVVYASYAYLKSLPTDNNKHIGRMLIISPLSAFAPWENEFEDCFGKKPVIEKLVGKTAKERRDYFILSEQEEITLISYQGASSDFKEIKNYLKKHNDVMVVLDEAHKIKNTGPDAVWATAILSIADHAKSRIVLTGTPAPNGYRDLWNLYKFIWPHKNVIEFPLHYLDNLRTSADKDKLIEQISPFFIRIKKSDLELPEAKYNPPIFVPMATDQREIYERIEKNYVEYFEAHSEANSITEKFKKAKLIRLRQCLTNPALLKKPLQEYQESGVSGINDRKILEDIRGYKSIPNKFVAAKELVEKISKNHGANGKVIIWAYFIDNIESLAEYLRKNDIPCKTLYGATPSENDETEENNTTREAIIREFHKDTCSYKVIIANPFVIGESISLHKACHNAIYLEKDFNAINYMQSKDRTHRYGLTSDDVVEYYYLLSEDTIDLTIHNRVLEKEESMIEIIERDEIPLLQMNLEDSDNIDDDIREIIRDYYDRKPAPRIS